MWVYTRPRNEHDRRFMLNLDHYPTITVNQLGERFFVDAGTGGETATLAATASLEEAERLVKHIFEALEAGKTALDLNVETLSCASPKAENRLPDRA